MKRYYFDYAATTPLLPEVKQKMVSVMEEIYGNPSSVHYHGRTAKAEVEDARKICAKLLNVSLGEVFFTSGATESNTTAILKSISDLGVKKIISSPTEHHCIIHTLNTLESDLEIEYLNVDAKGNIDLTELESLLSSTSETCLVSLMHGNNEIGSLHDISSVSQLCQAHNALLNVDAAQTYGKLPIDLQKTPVDFLAVSAHKIYGPKGVGLLYISDKNKISPLFHGGAQERNMRAGTENLISIAGFAKASEIASLEMKERDGKIRNLRTYFLDQLCSKLQDISVNGNEDELYLPNILSLKLPKNQKTEMLIFNLDIAGISASAGSACSSGVEQASHVLEAIAPDDPNPILRISLSHLHSTADLDYLVETLSKLCT